MHLHEDKAPHGSPRLLTAFLLNSSFAVIEIVGGVLTNSVAVLSDALHDLGDSLALGTAWYFERLGRKGRDHQYSYGYSRYTVIGAIVNAVVLIAGSVFVINEAIERLNAPQEVHGLGMMGLAVLGILVNGFAFSRLHSGHSHNVDVIRLHLLEDVLGWLIVLVGAIAIQIWSLYILDPVLSILVSAWIMYQVIRRLRKSVKIILQVIPAGMSTETIDQNIRKLPGVLMTHDTHLWTMDGNYHILTMHVVVDSKQTIIDLAIIKEAIRKELSSLKIEHATIEFEYPDEECGLAEH